ncbi:hypothetical protein C2125_06800 [Rahnella aquatilis]|nr:YopT-type cysteine protease domain-containing protein [Rahnella aquatilis]RBQ34963.1 hypothetical protein C2125_06800 [Rahnella aquatilis]
MLNRLLQYTNKTGGTYSFFSQVTYIQKNNWVANNPRNLGGAWLGSHRDPESNQIQYGLRGACYGLSAAYLIAGRDWRGFKCYMNSSASHRLILGIMNIQEQNSALKSKLTQLKKQKSLFDKFNRKGHSPKINYMSTEDAYHLIMKNEGRLISLKTSTLPQASTTAARIEGLVKSLRQNSLYEIGIYQGCQGGHSIAIRTDGNMIKFFDPNIGEISYNYNTKQIMHFMEALCMVFNEFYKNYNLFKVDEYYR